VLFPREGAENVITNLIGFGIEEHDDLADAFAYLVLGMVKRSTGLILG
jgi:phage terminase large subunit-like protein